MELQNSENLKSGQLTPLMRQYWDIKSLHQDKILLFRMGDFFEMFFEDAKLAAPVLGIALTSRNKKSQDETPMCGVPHHSIAGPINRLLKQGFKIAICDQIEDPKFAKGIVKRAVTRILTPGMVYDSDSLDAKLAHYLACWHLGNLACVDTTTGEAFVVQGINGVQEAQRLLQILPVVELLVDSSCSDLPLLKSLDITLTTLDGQSSVSAEDWIKKYILTSGDARLSKILKPFEMRSLAGRMDLSPTVIRHLEIFQNSSGETNGSLFDCIDRTKTAAGARLLRERLSFPLCSQSEIQNRLDRLDRWIKDLALTKRLREILQNQGDIERRLGRLVQAQANARDLRALAESSLIAIDALYLANKVSDFSELKNFCTKIVNDFVEEPPLSTKQGYLLKANVDAKLDELISLTTNSQGLLQELENREKLATGINSLKVRYNNIFGFYIEVTHTHKDRVPAHYMRKQTLTNAERYCTDELIELEKKVLSAQTRRFELESDLFESYRAQALEKAPQFLELSSIAAELDVETACAWLAVERKYCKPVLGDKSLRLQNSRHPVVEQTVKQKFTPNTIEIDSSACLLLTGPNMAGKSTLMRQVAIASIMAQSGFFVAAESAELPIFNHVFTRIGASDQLSQGLSTFMVEMTETAEMLKKAGPQSLLILDEIGRGTSTYDGMSLAQAILEFILKEVGAITLFATHYHELTHLNFSELGSLRNAHMNVIENKGEIQFLHTLTPGPAEKSYGIHVARLAGVPHAVTEKAEQILKAHESQRTEGLGLTQQLSFLEPLTEVAVVPNYLVALEKNIRALEVSNLTPLQALTKLAELQEGLVKDA